MTTEVLRNMIYAGSPALERPRVGRARRGPLPPGRLPRPGVGGGHRPPPAGGAPRVPVGHGLQRRRAGRLDQHGARPHRGGRRGRTAGHAWTTVPGGRPPGRADAPAARPRRRPGQPRRQPLRHRPPRRVAGPGRWPTPPSLCHPPPGRGGRAAGRRRRCSRRSTSSSAGPPATTPSRRCIGAGLRLTERRGAGPHPRDRRAPRGATSATTTCGVLGYDRWLAAARGRHRRPPRRDGARRSRRRWRPASSRAW